MPRDCATAARPTKRMQSWPRWKNSIATTRPSWSWCVRPGKSDVEMENASPLKAHDYATGRPLASDAPPNRYLAPAFFDPQVNGCLGVGFTSADLTVDDVIKVVEECLRYGVGGFCPTVITAGI